MSRGGRGGGGGISRGGGSRSSSRGGGGRPSSSRSSSSTRGVHMSTTGYSHSHGHHHSHSHGHRHSTRYATTYTDESIGNSIAGFIAAFVLVVSLIAGLTFLGNLFNSFGTSKNYIERVKLESGNGFMTNCVFDNSDFFKNEKKVESQLKEFYSKTGVQPVIITNYYDASVISNDAAFDWGVDYYNDNIDREDCLLFVYFDAKDINDMGYCAVVTGVQADSVMDSSAIEIFWNQFDKHWFNDSLSLDDVLVKTYVDTGKTIMTVHKTGGDVAFLVLAVLGVVVVGIVVIAYVNTKREAAKEKAESDERILNMDLSQLDDPLLNKYE